jgi:beta-barrel assembly-enhancing protease
MNAKFEGRVPDESVNLPKTHPLKDALTLFLGIFTVGCILFMSLGWVTEKAVLSMSEETEALLLKPFESTLGSTMDVQTSTAAKRVERIFESVLSQWESPPYKFIIRLVPGEPNAFAVPGGGIVVTTGLLEELESENELAFILGHELGHFRNRDHLRGLSRQIAFLVVKFAVLSMAGVDASNEEMLEWVTLVSQRASDRKRELEADRFGLKLVNGALGHVKGSTGFFERRKKEESIADSRLGKYLSTHPPSRERIDQMDSLTRKSDYVRTGTVTPW